MTDNSRADERSRMVERQIIARGIKNRRVLDAMRQIPRHLFVPPQYERVAYDDNPLPIGCGQTISQPYIVALMTELLDPQADDRILEIGTGSGYQAAILAVLAKSVTTIERIPQIAGIALSNLKKMGIANVTILTGDGTTGLPEQGPYNGIIVTAAAPHVAPQPLIDQLADGGRLVAPVGDRNIQELLRISRKGDHYEESRSGGVRFVPLIGRHGWEET